MVNPLADTGNLSPRPDRFENPWTGRLPGRVPPHLQGRDTTSMTITLVAPSGTAYRDPRELLNAVRPYVTEKTYNIFEAPGAEGIDLWER